MTSTSPHMTGGGKGAVLSLIQKSDNLIWDSDLKVYVLSGKLPEKRIR